LFILRVNIEGCNPDTEYTSWIREHYVFLLENLDVTLSGLIDYLFQDKVIDVVDLDDIRAARTSVNQNERLLSILGRKPAEKIQLFYHALDVTGQNHVKSKITGRPGCA